MSLLDDMAASDPQFACEIEGLTAQQRRWLEDDLTLRQQAAALAVDLVADASEIYHQLKQLRRVPRERLRMGLAHGRRRPRSAE